MALQNFSDHDNRWFINTTWIHTIVSKYFFNHRSRDWQGCFNDLLLFSSIFQFPRRRFIFYQRRKIALFDIAFNDLYKNCIFYSSTWCEIKHSSRIKTCHIFFRQSEQRKRTKRRISLLIHCYDKTNRFLRAIHCASDMKRRLFPFWWCYRNNRIDLRYFTKIDQIIFIS